MLLASVLAVAAAVPPPASGAGTADLIALLGPLDAEVGAWVEYLVRSRGEEDLRVRISVVPPALEAGRAWLEVTTLAQVGLPFAARLLFSRTSGVERALVYALGQAPVEIPLGELQAPPDTAEKRRSARRVTTRAGTSDVTIPAGTFRAEELRLVAGGAVTRVWRASPVPMWKLVRAESARLTVELTAYARHGARSVFPPAQGNGSEIAK